MPKASHHLEWAGLKTRPQDHHPNDIHNREGVCVFVWQREFFSCLQSLRMQKKATYCAYKTFYLTKIKKDFVYKPCPPSTTESFSLASATHTQNVNSPLPPAKPLEGASWEPSSIQRHRALRSRLSQINRFQSKIVCKNICCIHICVLFFRAQGTYKSILAFSHLFVHKAMFDACTRSVPRSYAILSYPPELQLLSICELALYLLFQEKVMDYQQVL